jgi:hypothetical protein
VLTELVHDAQRRLAEEAVVAATAREMPAKRKPDPPRYVDLTPYDGMDDRDVLLALGARKSDISYYRKTLERHRRADTLHASRGENRCEAGIAASLGLRCTLAALPGETWCRRHHPNPPVAVMTQAEQARARLRRDELWRRPDGRVLDALYELTDSVDPLCATTREALDRAQRLEASVEEKKSAWLDIDEAASYTRRTRAQVARAANNGELSGTRERPRSRWSFRPADLDRWRETGKYNSGRYATPLTPATRSRRRYQ